MNAINNSEVKTNNSKQKRKFLNVLKKILLYTFGGIGVILLLALLYKVFEFLFVGFVLLVACIGPIRWRRW